MAINPVTFRSALAKGKNPLRSVILPSTCSSSLSSPLFLAGSPMAQRGYASTPRPVGPGSVRAQLDGVNAAAAAEVPISSESLRTRGRSSSPRSPTPSSTSPYRFNVPGTNDTIAEPHSGPTHTLHVLSTRNNVILAFTNDRKGHEKVFSTISGGTDKTFKKSHRSSYEAAHQAALKMFNAIEEFKTSKKGETQTINGRFQIRVAFKGMFGQGREAVSAALIGPEGEDLRKMVVGVEDRTPIKIGGTRPKKARRL